jgi:hypothetical protein
VVKKEFLEVAFSNSSILLVSEFRDVTLVNSKKDCTISPFFTPGRFAAAVYFCFLQEERVKENLLISLPLGIFARKSVKLGSSTEKSLATLENAFFECKMAGKRSCCRQDS